uniref:Uncharacterized protein n=1 Tax=Xiphophorus maculatus TaxID=8083 RepID=A0A3B5Q1R3_XIPMA
MTCPLYRCSSIWTNQRMPSVSIKSFLHDLYCPLSGCEKWRTAICSNGEVPIEKKLIFGLRWLKLMSEVMKRQKGKKEPKMMKQTKYMYMYRLLSYIDQKKNLKLMFML